MHVCQKYLYLECYLRIFHYLCKPETGFGRYLAGGMKQENVIIGIRLVLSPLLE